MFTIFPLQVASNVFKIETPSDIEKFYHFINPEAINDDEFIKDDKIPSDVFTVQRLTQGFNDKAIISCDVPPGTSNILIFDEKSKILPINPGEMCIISPFTQNMKAYYRSKEKENSKENNESVD